MKTQNSYLQKQRSFVFSKRGMRLVSKLMVLSMIFLISSTQTISAIGVGQYDFDSVNAPSLKNRSFEDWSSNTSPNYWTVNSGVARKYIYKLDGSYGMNQYGLSGESKISQSLGSTIRNAVKGDQVSFTVYAKETYNTNDQTQLQIKVGYQEWDSGFGYYNTYRTYSSSWEDPGYNEWKSVSVLSGTIPSTTFSITVSILTKDINGGYHNLYYDSAKLGIMRVQSKSNSDGHVSMGIEVHQSEPKYGGYREITFSTSLGFTSVRSIDPRYISSVSFKVEMLPTEKPHWWSKTETTQDGTLTMYASGQGNDLGKSVNPAHAQESLDTLLPVGAVVFGTALGAVVGVVTDGIGYELATHAATEIIFHNLEEATTTFDNTAGGGSDYSTYGSWNYGFSGSPSSSVKDGYVHNAYNWMFKAGHGEYRLKITGKVSFGGVEWVQPFSGSGYYRGYTSSTLTFVDYIDV